MIGKTPKPGQGIGGNVFGQLMQTAKQTGKTAKSQLSPAKFLQAAGQQFGTGRGVGEAKPGAARSNLEAQKIQGTPVTDLTDQQFDQIKRQRDLEAMRRYREIQQAIQLYRQQKQQDIPKQISGQPGFDPEKIGQPQVAEESAPLIQPEAKKRRGIFGGFRGRLSRNQRQNLGTKELGKTKSG